MTTAAAARRIILVPFDQLSRDRGAMRDAVPGRDEILMVQSEVMLRSRTWHAQRLFMVLSAAAHHAHYLREQGFVVHERIAQTLRHGVLEFTQENPGATFHATEPRSRSLQRTLLELGFTLVPDDSFLTSRAQVSQAWNHRIPVMENFYRSQRQRLGVLVDNGKPTGGQWNFDADNRLPPPKGGHAWPAPLVHDHDELDEAIWYDILSRDLPITGSPPDGTWATTREGALRQLEHFITTGLAGFGPYEDAMPKDSWAANHSLLSPYLNLGLLNPDEVIQFALESYEQGDIPINSIEGFVRQIIGWREYINAVYWFFDEDYGQRNALMADQPLPPTFDDPQLTRLACVKSVVTDVHARGWVHHIPRLMVLANLSLIAGIRPQALLNWMRRMFVDAADWVMEPNVIGMGTYADGGDMTTKPYAAGGAYINRMGRYCRDCPFDPRVRVGDDACPFTTLYWDFLDRNAAAFSTNHRMGQQLAGLRNLSDIDQVRERAREVRSRLSQGSL